MTKKDDKYRQGKSKDQVRASYMGASFSIIGIFLIFLYLLLTK
jgi:hypothetical protein